MRSPAADVTRRAWRTALGVTLLPAVLAAGEPANEPMLGQPAPAFRLKDVLTGKTLALEDLRGRFVVLHFGASW